MNTLKKGKKYELEVRNYIEDLIKNGDFPVSKYYKVFSLKQYYSPDRDDYIEYDITIEEYINEIDMVNEEFFRVTIIECKNYKNKVEIGKVEEFHSKSRQVGELRCKAIFVTSSNISKQSLNYMKKHGIAFIRFNSELNDFNFILKRATSSNEKILTDTIIEEKTIHKFIGIDNETYTTSPKEFFYSFLNKKLKILSKKNAYVDYFSQYELQGIADEVLKEMGYISGSVDIFSLLDTVADNHNYDVIYRYSNKQKTLGFVDFLNKRIEIAVINQQNLQRVRFTIAHEISHILLKHDRYLLTDIFSEKQSNDNSQIAKLEFQANYLASCLLMPKKQILKVIFQETKHIKNKGFGKLFIDDQPCNFSPYIQVINNMCAIFEVSNLAMEIKLKELDLINDKREKHCIKKSEHNFSNYRITK